MLKIGSTYNSSSSHGHHHHGPSTPPDVTNASGVRLSSHTGAGDSPQQHRQAQVGCQATVFWLEQALPPLLHRVPPCVSPTLPACTIPGQESILVVPPTTLLLQGCSIPASPAPEQGCFNQSSALRSPQGKAAIPIHCSVPEGSSKSNDDLVISENPGAWRQETRESSAQY